MKESVNILGVNFHNVTMKEAVNRVLVFLESPKVENEINMIFTPNPEIVMMATDDEAFMKVLNKGALVIPDGIGVVIGSKFIKQPLKERVAGFDLMQNTFDAIKDKEVGVFFLGASPGVALDAAEKMKIKHPGLKIVGTQDGYFDNDQDVIEQINNSGAEMLLVGIGAPRQEMWIERYQNELRNIKVAAGVGGSFDGMSGKVKRAPIFFQKCGLEWFYRLIKQPQRFGRMLRLPLFLVAVIRSKKK